MGRLSRDIKEFEQLDSVLYGILVDKKENAMKLEQKYGLGKFPVYYDSNKKMANMLNQEVKIAKAGRLPGLLIVDKEGIIQYAYYGDSMSDIPKNSDVFEVLKKLK